MKINVPTSLGKGEVVCSIHTGSTTLSHCNPYTIRSFSWRFTGAYLRLLARERVMNMQPLFGDGFGDEPVRLPAGRAHERGGLPMRLIHYGEAHLTEVRSVSQTAKGWLPSFGRCRRWKRSVIASERRRSWMAPTTLSSESCFSVLTN